MFPIVLFALFIATVYWYFTRTFGYWEKRGVKHDKPKWLVGNNLQGYLQKQSMTEVAVDQYKRYPNERVVGFFRSTRPVLIIRDPDIVKRILMTNFDHFYYRGLIQDKETVEPMMRNLFHVDGDLWRLLRQRMTGAFTSGKLKAMFPLVVERAERLQARIEASIRKGKPLNARELMARFTTDFIGACGFGLDADTLNDEDSQFRKLGAKIFEVTLWDGLKAAVKEFFPEITTHVRLLGKIEADMASLVENILKQRNYQPSGRNDFIDLLLECQKKGAMVAESLKKFKQDGTPELAIQELTENLMMAQIFIFFAAGFETSSSTTSYMLHELAYHPEVQQKVQADIDRVLAKYEGKLSYEAIKEMTYLDWCFKESLRLFPSVGFLMRECSRKYTFKDLNFSVDEGVRMIIPVQALHTDPAYFPEPEKFRPERFSPDEYIGDNKYVYLPFGEGPRSCIGTTGPRIPTGTGTTREIPSGAVCLLIIVLVATLYLVLVAGRLGHMQSLAGLAAVLSRFSVEPAPESVRHPKIDPRSHVVQLVEGGLPLIFRERKL